MSEQTVFIVDDDEAMRRSLRRLMESAQLRGETFSSAEEFLQHFDPARVGCLVLDVRMEGMSGLDLQDELAVRGALLPIILISAHGDVPQVVRAIRAGAVDFLRKPYSGKALLERVRHGLAKAVQMRTAAAERAAAEARLERLSAREREIAELMAAGWSATQVAEKLQLSRKTVDVHRGNILRKTRTESTLELMRIVQTAGSRGTAPKPFP